MRGAFFALAAVLLALGGTGCGGGGHAPPAAVLGKAFEGRAASACRTALAAKKAQGPFPFPAFNPTKPDLSKLPSIGRLEARTVKIYDAWLRRMVALGQPPAGRAAWAGVVSALRSNGRFIADQQRAASRRDGRTFTRDYYGGSAAQRRLERAAVAAGVPACRSAAAA